MKVQDIILSEFTTLKVELMVAVVGLRVMAMAVVAVVLVVMDVVMVVKDDVGEWRLGLRSV